MLWQRLKQLERSCEVRIESYLAASDLRWRATIRPRDGGASEIVCDHADITDAIREALARAARLGWITDEPDGPL